MFMKLLKNILDVFTPLRCQSELFQYVLEILACLQQPDMHGPKVCLKTFKCHDFLLQYLEGR